MSKFVLSEPSDYDQFSRSPDIIMVSRGMWRRLFFCHAQNCKIAVEYIGVNME